MARNLAALSGVAVPGYRDRQFALLAQLLLAIALALWFGNGLGDRALWSPDEGRYAEIPREMVASGDYLTPRLNGVKYFEKPPLVYWLTAGSIRTFGLNEWALRLGPALFAVLGCLAVFALGRRLFGTTAGVLAAAILATSPLYDVMGGALTIDMPLAVLLTAALGAFLLGQHGPPGTQRRLWLYVSYVAVALAVLTKGLIGIVIPAMVIGAWIVLLGEWKLVRELQLASGLAIVVAIAAPWHWLVSQANHGFAEFYFYHEHFERYLTPSHGRAQPAWFFIAVLAAGMFPWSPLLFPVTRLAATKLWRERRAHRETWFLLLWAIVPLAFFSFSSSKLAPYVLPVLPALALLLGRRLALAWDGSGDLSGWAFLALALVGTALCLVVAMSPELFARRASFGIAAAQLGVSLYAMAGALVVAAAVPLVAFLWGTPRSAIVALLVAACGFSLALDHTLRKLESLHSVKEVAHSLRSQLRPGDEVMTYQAYYQDLPVYLERRITVVDWTGELKFGSTIEDTSAWMIDRPAFRKRWVEPRTIYLLTNAENARQLLHDLSIPSCVAKATPRVTVLVNQECR